MKRAGRCRRWCDGVRKPSIEANGRPNAGGPDTASDRRRFVQITSVRPALPASATPASRSNGVDRTGNGIAFITPFRIPDGNPALTPWYAAIRMSRVAGIQFRS